MVGNIFPDFSELLRPFLWNLQTFQEISGLFQITMKMIFFQISRPSINPEYLIHYIKFKFWAALFYVNFLSVAPGWTVQFFPSHERNGKLVFLNVGQQSVHPSFWAFEYQPSLYFQIFAKSLKTQKIGNFEYWLISCNSQYYPFQRKIVYFGIFKYQPRLYFFEAHD